MIYRPIDDATSSLSSSLSSYEILNISNHSSGSHPISSSRVHTLVTTRAYTSMILMRFNLPATAKRAVCLNAYTHETQKYSSSGCTHIMYVCTSTISYHIASSSHQSWLADSTPSSVIHQPINIHLHRYRSIKLVVYQSARLHGPEIDWIDEWIVVSV